MQGWGIGNDGDQITMHVIGWPEPIADSSDSSGCGTPLYTAVLDLGTATILTVPESISGKWGTNAQTFRNVDVYTDSVNLAQAEAKVAANYGLLLLPTLGFPYLELQLSTMAGTMTKFGFLYRPASFDHVFGVFI